MSDKLFFDPSDLRVSVGDVVTFVVTNDGQTDHEFVLGDAAYQRSHEAEMSGDSHMMGSENALTVAPGEVHELTWRFTEAGTVLYGCHEPGHYKGGMVGKVDVNA